MSSLVLYDLRPSPNNIKVRLALGYKRLDYELRPVDPRDRTRILALSGQPFTPVLQHGEVVMFDSSAILRYVEANVAREPRLYSADPDTMRAIERWELRTRGGGFGAPVGMGFDQFFSKKREADELAGARDLFEDRCREIEEALSPAGFLVGDALTAADICVVSLLSYGAPTEAMLEDALPILSFLCETFAVPADCPRTRDYVQRVLQYDRRPAQAVG